MIKFETQTGKDLGTLKMGKDGTLDCSSAAVLDLVNAKRDVYRWDDLTIYRWFAAGGLDNGFVVATEVAA